MRVFIAGATGVIGRRVLDLLVADGHIVTGTTHSPQAAQEIRSRGAEAAICDLLDAEAVNAAVHEARPEGVIYELSTLPPWLRLPKYKSQLEATNRLRREGTRNLVAAAANAGAIRLVAQSVAFAYAATGDWVKAEDAPLAVDSPAPDRGAIAAIVDLEDQVLAADGIVLRYGYLYGPGTHFAPDGFYARLARRRMFPMIASGTGHWSLVHVDDAAAATVAALERASPGIYNVVDDDPAPVHDWLPVYADALGAKPPRRLPLWASRLIVGSTAVAGMTIQRGASNARAKRELGWSPRYPSWRDGFRTAAG